MALKSFSFKTKDGFEHWVNRWIPDVEEGEETPKIKAVIVFNHGLAEHSLRYDRFGSILSENGYIFNAFDMRGHGRTAEISLSNKTGDYGKLGDKDGFTSVVNDIDEMIDSVKAEYPEVPVILMGHSFGSFIAQGYIEEHSEKIKACFLIGTAGPRLPLVTVGNFLAKIIRAFRGKDSIVKFLDTLSFGSYNNKIKNPETPHDWLTKDKLIVQLYEEDKWCGFPLKTSFYCDMTSGLCKIHKASNIKKISKSLPVYFLYGSDDPVGDYGKTVKALYNIYKKNGMEKVYIKEYPEDRHEILNETDREQVESDILAFLNECV